jgi:hypothetical protein
MQMALTDNAAALQQRVTVANNPFLATLSAPGAAQFLTAQKPCSILLPHNHQKASELFSVLFGAQPSPPDPVVHLISGGSSERCGSSWADVHANVMCEVMEGDCAAE